MYKSASKFQMSINKPDRQSHPKEEFVWALLSRVVEMTAYQLLVTEIKRRSSELRRLDHPSALCTVQSLDALPSLETISMISKHEMLSLSRSSIDNILLQSHSEYTRYRGACEQAISACKKFQESIEINSKLPRINSVRRFDR